MSSSKLGDKLNFVSQKGQAAESKQISSAIPPRSGVVFAPSQVIEFAIPGNRPNEFLDVVNSVKIKLPVTVNGAAATLDRGGAYGFFNKVELVQNGVVLSSVPRANLLITGLSDFAMESSYKSSTGRLMEGFEGDCLRGAIMADGASRTFFLSLLTANLAMTTPHRDLYLGSSAEIILRLTLESSVTALKSAAGAATYIVQSPELHMTSTYLMPPAMDELNRAVKGDYKMLCNSYDHMSANIAQGATTAHIKLSFAKASLERILFFIRPNSHFSQTAGTGGPKFSLGSRCTATLQSYQLSIAGTLVPQVPIRADTQGAEFMYSLLGSDNIVSNYAQGTAGLLNSYTIGVSNVEPGTSSLGSAPQIVKSNPFMLPGLANGSGGDNAGKSADDTVAQPSNIGTFIGAVNLEGGLITSGNSPIYSGVNTLNGTDMYIDMTFSAVPADSTIDFYSLSTELVFLDKDTNMWSKRS
tara:strand:+ start:1838 stop:3247 length:1410 start_codon:yes stop_codon:yes gene_type:complete